MGIAADFVLIVIAGLLGGLLARFLRLPLLVGYVAAGILVGPHTAGPTVGQIHEIELLAEIGVALLLFSLGLEVSFRDLQPVRRVALLGGPIQVVLTCMAGALGAMTFLGMPGTEAIWFGAMISVSSTMVVLKTLSNAGTTSTLASRVMIGLLVLQDLAVIPMLVILPQLRNLENIVPNLVRSIAIAAAILLSMVFLGTKLLPKLLQRILGWGSQELFLVAVVATGVGVGYATHSAGLSFALGAFVAGITLSESEFSHQALSDVAPLRDIFGLLFFVTVGMLFDPQYAWSHLGLIMATVVGIFVLKAAILGGIARMFGYGNMAPWIIGLGLSQIGEFSFVLARTGLSSGSISKATYDLALTCTVLTMALSPVVSALALPFGRRWPARVKSDPTKGASSASLEGSFSNHAIVAGYGRTGRAVAQVLRAANIPLVVVDFQHALLADIQASGANGLWGDITRDEILHAAQVDKARLLILTVPNQNLVGLSIERARRLNPDLLVIARAVRERHLLELRRLHVNAAVQPEFEGGIEMVRQALSLYGFNHTDSTRLIADLRDELYGVRDRHEPAVRD